MTSLQRFWRYIEEREEIRRRRLAGVPYPWSKDPIFVKYRFTNVRRWHDRTTQELFALYSRSAGISTPAQCLLNAAIGRYFGTSSFYNAVGWQKDFNRNRILATADRFKFENKPIFTRAYVITNGGQSCPKEEYVAQVLSYTWAAADRVTTHMIYEKSWAKGFYELSSVPGFGGTGFMAKEVLQDYLLMRPYDVLDGDTWTPVGPGARRGLNRFFRRKVEFPQPAPIFIMEVQRIRNDINPLWGKAYPQEQPLTAHDIQFCLCEFDKYERARLGEGEPKNRYIYKERK